VHPSGPIPWPPLTACSSGDDILCSQDSALIGSDPGRKATAEGPRPRDHWGRVREMDNAAGYFLGGAKLRRQLGVSDDS
jgi:hypothetical protein